MTELNGTLPANTEVNVSVEGGKVDVKISTQKERFAIIDIETGGFHKTKNGLCEIGLLIIDEDGKIYEALNWLIRPYRRRDPDTKEILEELVSYKDDAMKINGLSEDLLRKHGADAGLVCAAFEALLRFHRVKKAVGHNIKSFDNLWIEEFTDRFGKGFKFEELIDTKEIAKEKLKYIANHKLETLCAHFKVTNKEAHRALGDCHATKEIYFKLR